MAQPCATFAQGLAAVTSTRNTVLVAPGSYSETVSISSGTVKFIATGAQLQPSALGQPIMIITDNANVAVRGLVIQNAGGSTNADGVRCSVVTSGAPSISLNRVTIKGCSGVGINATSCAVDLEQSNVSNNTSGGIVLSGSTFSLVNNFIFGNGGSSSTAGGVSVRNITAVGTHVLDFNTITQNNAADAVNSGVDCVLVNTPLGFRDTIVYGNQTIGSGKQVGGNMCAWTYSDISDTVAGTGNITGDPKFVSAATGNYHLMTGSPCIDAANPASTVLVDYDGDTRPNGPHSDIGADEVVQ